MTFMGITLVVVLAGAGLFLLLFLLGLIKSADVTSCEVHMLFHFRLLTAIFLQRKRFLAVAVHLDDGLGALSCDGLKVGSQILIC